MAKPVILIIGTLDTKALEITYLHDQIVRDGRCSARVLDVGSNKVEKGLQISEEAILRPVMSEDGGSAAARADIINAVIAGSVPLVNDMVKRHAIHGVVSAGGSCNSSIATAIMRQTCPIGFPKLMVSTMASGDTRPFVAETDITIMPSIVDVAGLNSVLEQVLDNAASAIVGMALAYAARSQKGNDGVTVEGGRPREKRRIAITMFGVTTPCVDHIREILSSEDQHVEYEVYVFHATGAGGKAMERLVREGQIDAVIDLTTTEIADELFGGVLNAGPNRLEASAEKGIPYLVSVGATDMVNFGPRDTVPEKYRKRNLVVHNPALTLMRVNKEECRQIGDFIAEKLRTSSNRPNRIKVVLPVDGVSMLDCKGQPFYDPEADEELFRTIEVGLRDSQIEVIREHKHINSPTFAQQLVETVKELMAS